MGIKFRCPNGHKLNVKSFLAGKRGICPHCGIGVDIPGENEGTVKAGQPAKATAAVPANAATPAPRPVPAAAIPGATAVAAPQTVRPTEPATFGQAGAAFPNGGPAYASASPVTTPTAASPVATPAPSGASLADPIAEAPSAVWYVRPPSGGQFGPAKGDIMRKWIAEGRVSADSLVWREGWADWKTAGPVFPALSRAGAAAVATAAPAVPPSAMPANPLSQPLVSTSATSKSRAAARPKSSNTLAIVAVVLLAVISVILLVVCILVFSGFSLGSKKHDTSQLRPIHSFDSGGLLPAGRLSASTSRG